MGVAACQGLGAEAQSVAGAAIGGTGFGRQDFASAFLLPGHRASQLANAAAEGKRLRSGPTSASRAWAVSALMPGTVVRSTPKSLCRSDRIWKWNRFLRRFC